MLHLIARIAMLANVHTAHAPALAHLAHAPQVQPPSVASVRVIRVAALPQDGPTVGPGEQPTAQPGTDTTSVKGFNPMKVPDVIDWGKITNGFKGILTHFGGIITACLGLLFILMAMWAGVLYQFNSGNTRAIDQVRTKVKHIMEGAFIALGAGFFFAIITLIASTFQGA